jgi:hypothetical protein
MATKITTHEELAAMGPVRVQVKEIRDGVGQRGVATVVLTMHERTGGKYTPREVVYMVGNEDCGMFFFKAQKRCDGNAFTVVAEGSGKTAKLTYGGEPGDQLPPRPEDRKPEPAVGRYRLNVHPESDALFWSDGRYTGDPLVEEVGTCDTMTEADAKRLLAAVGVKQPFKKFTYTSNIVPSREPQCKTCGDLGVLPVEQGPDSEVPCPDCSALPQPMADAVTSVMERLKQQAPKPAQTTQPSPPTAPRPCQAKVDAYLASRREVARVAP